MGWNAYVKNTCLYLNNRGQKSVDMAFNRVLITFLIYRKIICIMRLFYFMRILPPGKTPKPGENKPMVNLPIVERVGYVFQMNI